MDSIDYITKELPDGQILSPNSEIDTVINSVPSQKSPSKSDETSSPVHVELSKPDLSHLSPQRVISAVSRIPSMAVQLDYHNLNAVWHQDGSHGQDPTCLPLVETLLSLGNSYGMVPSTSALGLSIEMSAEDLEAVKILHRLEEFAMKTNLMRISKLPTVRKLSQRAKVKKNVAKQGAALSAQHGGIDKSTRRSPPGGRCKTNNFHTPPRTSMVTAATIQISSRETSQVSKVGKGKKKVPHAGDPPLPVPVQSKFASMTAVEVIRELRESSRRRSKTTAYHLFWGGVWNRLESNGWTRKGDVVFMPDGKYSSSKMWEDRKALSTATPRPLLFLAPGTQEDACTKGIDAFSSWIDILDLVARDPSLLDDRDSKSLMWGKKCCRSTTSYRKPFVGRDAFATQVKFEGKLGDHLRAVGPPDTSVGVCVIEGENMNKEQPMLKMCSGSGKIGSEIVQGKKLRHLTAMDVVERDDEDFITEPSESHSLVSWSSRVPLGLVPGGLSHVDFCLPLEEQKSACTMIRESIKARPGEAMADITSPTQCSSKDAAIHPVLPTVTIAEVNSEGPMSGTLPPQQHRSGGKRKKVTFKDLEQDFDYRPRRGNTSNILSELIMSCSLRERVLSASIGDFNNTEDEKAMDFKVPPVGSKDPMQELRNGRYSSHKFGKFQDRNSFSTAGVDHGLGYVTFKPPQQSGITPFDMLGDRDCFQRDSTVQDTEQGAAVTINPLQDRIGVFVSAATYPPGLVWNVQPGLDRGLKRVGYQSKGTGARSMSANVIVPVPVRRGSPPGSRFC